jgi:hypothetical protein
LFLKELAVLICPKAALNTPEKPWEPPSALLLRARKKKKKKKKNLLPA